MIQLGTFDVSSGKVRVTDPCYTLETWCAGTLTNVMCGRWKADIEQTDEGSWGTRNAVLHVVAEGFAPTGPWQEAQFEVGVDSGQAGIFDLAKYPKGETGEYGEKGTFYDRACNLTVNHGPRAGVMPEGVVTSSGFGDGGYTCYFRTTPKGEIVEIKVVFIGDEEDEE